MSLIAKKQQPVLSTTSKLAIIPTVIVAGLAVGAGVTAVQAALKTKAETGSIKLIPFAKNLAGQTFKNTRMLVKAAPILF